MPIFAAFLQGAALGLTIAAPLGPINVEIIRRHLSRGFAAGLLLGLGACSVDTGYILLISVGLITVEPGPAVRAGLAIAGAIILLALAVMIIRSSARSARLAASADRVPPRPVGLLRHYFVGLAMTAASPMNLVFWFGVIVSGAHQVANPWGPWPTVAGVLLGTVCWVVALNLLLLTGRRLLRPRLLVAVNLVSAGVLSAFAVRAIVLALSG